MSIACPTASVRSMNGVVVRSMATLKETYIDRAMSNVAPHLGAAVAATTS